jgi:hypothetical protein
MRKACELRRSFKGDGTKLRNCCAVADPRVSITSSGRDLGLLLFVTEFLRNFSTRFEKHSYFPHSTPM